MAGQVPRALWKRLPTYFPNIQLTMYRPAQEDWQQAQQEGFLARVRALPCMRAGVCDGAVPLQDICVNNLVCSRVPERC